MRLEQDVLQLWESVMAPTVLTEVPKARRVRRKPYRRNPWMSSLVRRTGGFHAWLAFGIVVVVTVTALTV